MLSLAPAATIAAASFLAAPLDTTKTEPISLERSLEPLVDHFNRNRGRPRFVALLSATCPACLFGAKAVRASVLEAYPEAELPVTIVWIDMLPTDNEAAAKRSSRIFEDPRVKQFHDPDRKAGRAIARDLLYEDGGPAWDIYLFYDKDAEWTDRPPEPVDWMHQLSGARRADPSRFRPGPQLTKALKEATAGILAKEASALSVQLLNFPGCPNSSVMLANLKEALQKLGVAYRVQDVNLQELDPADPRLCFGSPTVLINGIDLMGQPWSDQRALSCRIYAGGKPPGPDRIAQRLRSCCLSDL